MISHEGILAILGKHHVDPARLHDKPQLTSEASLLLAIRDASRLRAVLRDILDAAKPT